MSTRIALTTNPRKAILHAFKVRRSGLGRNQKENIVKNVISLSIVAVVLLTAAFACSTGPLGISSFKLTKDKAGTQDTSSYKSGETLYGRAVIANTSGAVKVKFRIETEDVEGSAKGTTVKGSDVTVDLPSDGTATYEVPIPSSGVAGKYNVIADLLDDKGDKKDSKTQAVTIEK